MQARLALAELPLLGRYSYATLKLPSHTVASISFLEWPKWNWFSFLTDAGIGHQLLVL